MDGDHAVGVWLHNEEHNWDLVDQPPKRKVISTKWVYKINYKSNGVLDKYKAQIGKRFQTSTWKVVVSYLSLL